MKKLLYLFFLPLVCLQCSPKRTVKQTPTPAFQLRSADHTNLHFNNQITETDSLNYFTYPYLYLGAGVATGDFNNDGKTDIFFSGNMVNNALYINQSNWHFTEIAEKAGVSMPEHWATGVTLVDINNDGWLDIYVCASGQNANTANQLFLNNQDLTFTEVAAEYGLADESASIQSVFFDYDNDGDLDCLVANYPTAPFGASNFYYVDKMRNLDPADSDHLYRNNGNGTFTDVSEVSGIANYGLTLGLSVADFNNDGFSDVYLSNDFATPDRFFFNNGDGTFVEKIKETTFQTALFGMGCDAADFNNDGLIDLMQADMTPKDNRRSKENMASMNPQAFWDNVAAGFHYQYMYNALQLNRGKAADDTDLPTFSNVSRLAGMASTDWSWATLFADFDNDGWKDVFITNGIKREVNNRDFHDAMKMKINFTKDLSVINHEDIPSEPVANFVFQNTGATTGLGFLDKSTAWNLDLKGFSHGCAVADFDNDGDLDLVVNNMDAKAAIYQNQLAQNDYLRIQLQGSKNNRLGIGATVEITTKKQQYTQNLSLSRGYQSAVEPILHFGLGKNESIQSLKITWGDGKVEILENGVSKNQLLTLRYANAQKKSALSLNHPKVFTALNQVLPENAKHLENNYNDYGLEPLLPYETSKLGGHLTVGDANGDGLEDFFLGNAMGESGALFLQNEKGGFSKITTPWEEDKNCEDLGSLLFDADNDGDLDLYVVSGGNEFSRRPEMLQDRLYINIDNKTFVKSMMTLPKITGSGGRVTAADYDNDGDLDLFVGGRLNAAKYPLPGKSYLLKNNGQQGVRLQFDEVTEQIAPELADIGMVTDARWSDIDGDNDLDLIVVGEWMPINIFRNEAGRFYNDTPTNLRAKTGWWSSITTGDFDEDGDLDLLVGNLGQNYKYQAADDAPFSVYFGDFDKNGRNDIVLGYQQNGTQFPLRGRQCSSEQIPTIALKFKDYHSFATANLEDIYGKNSLANATHFQATTFSSVFVENKGNNEWNLKPLPALAQVSNINDILVQDVDADGHLDAIIAGNLYTAEVETPRNDASLGLWLKGDGAGNFTAIDAAESGLFLPGDVKDLAIIKREGGQKAILAGVNNGAVRLIQCSKPLPETLPLSDASLEK